MKAGMKEIQNKQFSVIPRKFIQEACISASKQLFRTLVWFSRHLTSYQVSIMSVDTF